MFCVPSVEAYIPVMSVDRDGAQTGALANALRYSTPSEASLSRFGV